MDLPPHKTGTVENGDVTLFYRHFGDAGGDPILIVHGLSYFSYDWIPVSASLASVGREVVAMDMRGFGDSTRSPSRAYAIENLASDCVAILDHLKWDKVDLMGHSMGGRVATWCAYRHPERVKALVLCDYSPVNARVGSRRVARTVAGVPDKFATVDDALEYFGKDRDLPAGHPHRLRMEAYLAPVENGLVIKRDPIYRERFRKVLEGDAAAPGPDMWGALAGVTCPILVVRGTRSDMFAEENVERVKATNAGITLVEIDAGHDIAGDAPEVLITQITTMARED